MPRQTVWSKRGQRIARGRARKFAMRLAKVKYRKGAPSVYKFKESYVSTVTALASSGVQGILTGQMSSLTNVGQYSGLFDLYRITGMKVTFLPYWNTGITSLESNITGTNYVPGGIPVLYIAPNRDPQVPAPANLPDIINDDGVKMVRLDKKRSFFVKYPKPELFDAAAQALPLLFNNKVQPWLSTGGGGQAISQISNRHFGFRYWIDNGACPNSLPITVVTTLYFQMKERD